MAYADQSMSGNRVVALIVVGIIHLAVGYALVTGLAYQTLKRAIERVTTVDVEEPPPTKEPPPPPKPTNVPPPPVAPPPPISIATAAPQIRVQENIPVTPPAPPIRIVAPAAPPAPPPPNPPQPRGRMSDWVTTNDYPRRALREEEEGTTRVNLTVGIDGKVEGCVVTSSSGHPDLDDAVCKNATRRARFHPGTREGKEVVTTFPFAVTWRIPKD